MKQLSTRLRCAAILAVGLGFIGANLRAEEDPAVTRAREIARQQYELEKATRQAAEAKQKLAEQEALQRAIALTRQGVISIYNPGNAAAGFIPFSYRWKLWDGTFTDWGHTKVEDKKSLYFSKLGGIKFEIKFSSTGGGEKTYLLESNQLPNDVKAASDDAKPHQFNWTKANALDLFTGKPKNW